MNLKLISVFCILRMIEVVLGAEYKFECVKRRSGTCKAFNVSTDFDHFIEFKALNDGDPFSTIIEIDYLENKYSYERQKTFKETKVDTFNNPIVEILFSEDKDPVWSFRLVLGEKLNRLAYIDVVDLRHSTKYNNYSPDLPSWPFAINVTFDGTELTAHTKNGDGFDKPEPFLYAQSDLIEVQYMAVRNRNKGVKLVGFYDCSTKYGSNCGNEKTQTITDCRGKFSPQGSGFFNSFVDMSKYNRLGKNKSNKNIFEYDEIFGIYRQNNDSMHILFSKTPSERGAYVLLTIGDEINVRVRTRNLKEERTWNKDTFEYYEKDAVKRGWNQQPSEPNFIRVKLSTVSKRISIFSLDDTDVEKPILTMKLCNYFEFESIRFMSITSNRFYTVDLYFDCCLPNERDECHVYEKNHSPSEITKANSRDNSRNSTTETDENETYSMADNDGENITDSTTETDENIAHTTIIPAEADESDHYEDRILGGEIKYSEGVRRTRTFLDTSDFSEVGSAQYVYATGTSMTDYCPEEIEEGDVQLQGLVKEPNTDEDEDESEYQSPLSGGGGGGISVNILKGLLG